MSSLKFKNYFFLIKKIIINLFGNIIFLLSYISPKMKNIWIFGSWGGEKYADNSKYLFEYVNKKQKEITAIWLTHNSEVLRGIREGGAKAYKINSLWGIFYSMFAKVGIVTNGLVDINFFATGRMQIVQLWHGIPLKPVLYSDQKKKTRRKFLLKKLLSFFFPFYYKDVVFSKHLLFASSEYTKKIFSKVFNNGKIRVTGFPRNDALFNKKKISILEEKEFSLGIYMPTYRFQDEYDILAFLEDESEELEEFLKKERIILYVKLHPFHEKKINFLEKLKFIKVLKIEVINGDIYSVLNKFNFLITDYSSIMFDYLLLKRPIILTPFDYNQYINKHGSFLMNYNELPFPRAENWDEAKKHLKRIKDNKFKVDLEQINFAKKINTYFDSQNSLRVFNVIKNQIKL